MYAEIPFSQISRDEDRSWSLRLVDELAQGHLAELEKILAALGSLDDYRATARLQDLLADSERSDAIRQAASDALFRSTSVDTPEERAAWWKSGDQILMRHAIRMAEREEADLVVKIASDPKHPFHVDAIQKLEFWEAPPFQKLIVNALSHKDAEVRATAASALLWEQPVIAEGKLLSVASQSDEKAALAALDVLCYCASQEILFKLVELRSEGSPKLCDAYQNALGYVIEEFDEAMQCERENLTASNYFDRWLAPVRKLILSEAKEDKASESGSNAESKRDDAQADSLEKTQKTSVNEIIADLSDVDGMWLHKKHGYYSLDHWIEFDRKQRQQLTQFLLQHSDPSVRDICCRACVVWQDLETLVQLSYDPTYGVRKTAAYSMKFFAPDKSAENRLWDLLSDPSVMNVFGQETLDSYIIHTTREDKNSLLLHLALQDERPSLRRTSIYALEKAAAAQEIAQLRTLLAEEPFNTWCVHTAVLSACVSLQVPLPSLSHLEPIDNLWLQIALADAIGAGQFENR